MAARPRTAFDNRRVPALAPGVSNFAAADGSSVARVDLFVATRKNWLRFFADRSDLHAVQLGFGSLVCGIGFSMVGDHEFKPF